MMARAKRTTTNPIDYNSGIHKGRNLSWFLSGWGLWVMVFRPISHRDSFSAFPNIAGGVFVGLFYLLLGLICGRMIVRKYPRLGLSLMIGGYLSIVMFFAANCYEQAVRTGEWLHVWSTAIYTYGGLGFIGLTAIGEYVQGEK